MKGDGKGNLGTPSTISASVSGDVLTADLNGDGRPDLIVSGSVFLNQGNGAFSSPTSYASISNSLAQKAFGLGDVNGDGRIDMIFGNPNTYGSTGQLMVAYGNGDGTFGAATAVANTGTTIRQFFIAGVDDLKGDGRARVMIASSGAVAALLGATPASNPLYATSGFRAPQTLIADFNRDGCVDFAIPADNSIIIVFGKPDGTFTGAVSQPTIGGASVVFADTNGDGIPDAIAGMNLVYPGLGDGTFSSTSVQSSDATTYPLYLANFNGDGKPDLFSYQNVATGNGDGTFAAPQFLNNLGHYQSIPDFPTTFAAIADFNHDGLDDIAAGFSAQNVALALSTGGGNYSYSYLPISEAVGPIGAADLDHDGCIDLAVAGSAHLFIYKGNCAGGFTQVASYATNVTNPNSYSATTAGTSSPADIAITDLDHDGSLDIVYTIPSQNQAQILYGNGDGTFAAGTPITVSHSSLNVTAGDLDGDGFPDLIFSGSSFVSIVYGGPNRSFAPERLLAAGAQIGKAAVADLDLDGKLDFGLSADNWITFLNHGPAANTSGVTAALTIAPEPSPYGNTAQGTATFTAVNNAAVPTGFANILVDGVPSGTAALDKTGKASFSLSTLNAGGHTVSVVYQGDLNFRTAIATATHTVSKAPTTLTLVSASNPVTTIGSVNLAITANVSPTVGLPAQVVQLFDGGTLIGSLPMDSSDGNANFQIASLSAGTHVLTASYSGSANFAASSASLTEVVTLVPSVTTVSLPTGTALFEGPVAINISVGPVQGTFVPTGTVSCATGSVNLGSVTLVNGSARLVTTALPAGVDGVSCNYAGDSTFAASNSNSLSITITSRTVSAVSLSVTAGGNPVTAVQAKTVVTVTAQVTVGGAAVTAGQVKFCDGATPCTGPHVVGSAQLTATGVAVLKFIPAPGIHSYVADFVGTTSLTPARSSATALNVTGNIPNTPTLTASGAAGNYRLTATIGGTVASPTGIVSFLDLSNNNYPLATAPLVAGSKTFGFLSSNLTAANVTSGVQVGDFNGDGIPDLAVASSNPAGITIYLGNGDGTFTVGTTLQTYDFSLVVADFNGDGIQDIAALNNVGYSGAVFLGKGDGTFAAPISLLQDTGGPFSMVSGDFNNDGIPDLALANESAGTATILLGKGDGTFTAAPTLSIGPNPRTVVTGDFNGDGNADLAFSTGGTGSVTIMLGNGDGTFTNAASPNTSSNPVTLVVGDFDGDGKLDLAVANNGFNTISILLGNGDGTFRTLSTTPSTGSTPIDMTVGDFNGDGKADLAVANESSNTITMLLGNGDGTFTRSSQVVGTLPEHIAAADFNGDGMTDIVVGNVGSSFETLLLAQQTSTATATAAGISPMGTGTHQVQASYPGDSNYAASQSNTVGLTAQPLTSSLALSASSSPITYGQGELTATLAPYKGQGHTTDGEAVTFLNGTTSVGTGSLQSGVATLSPTALGVGTYSLTAIFGGDTNFTGSASPAISVTVAPGAPTITFAVANHTLGDAPFAVSATSNSASPLSYTVVSGPATISGSTVTVTGVGTVVLQASQASAGNYLSGSQQTSFTVNRAAPSVALVTGSGAVFVGNPLVLTATVSSPIGTPTGSVTFLNGSTPLGTAAVSAGVAALTASTLPTGSQTLTAVYSGDTSFAAANSGAVAETVQDLAVTTSTASQTASAGATANFVFALSPTNGTTFPAAVNFAVSGLPTGSTAAFTPSSLAAGSGPTNVMLAITVPQATAFSPLKREFPGQAPPISAGWLLLPFTVGLSARRRVRQSGNLLRQMGCVVLCIATTLAISGLTGCGGSSNKGPQPQSYTITITISSGALSHSTTTTLTVQ